MPYRELMAIPVKAFWLMSGNIRRIRAGDDLRNLMTASAVQNAEGFQEYRERLIVDMGEVVKEPSVIEVERDEAGFAELRSMAEAM